MTDFQKLYDLHAKAQAALNALRIGLNDADMGTDMATTEGAHIQGAVRFAAAAGDDLDNTRRSLVGADRAARAAQAG